MRSVRKMTRRLATFSRNQLLDLRYAGGFMGISRQSRFESEGAYTSGYTDYRVLADIFDGEVGPDDVLVDIGCGKGRVVGWWSRQYPNNRVIGIELDANVAANARRRLQRRPNVTIIAGNAVDSLPTDGTIFYMFNPFDASVMRAIADRLADLTGDVRVFYHYCQHLDVFENDHRLSVTLLPIPGSRPSAKITPCQGSELDSS